MTTPTPTGFKFVDNNGVEKDFAEVFDITNTGTVTTGYKSTAYNGDDLGKIFKAGINSGITTSYKYSTNIDLGSIFALPNSYSTPIITAPTTLCYKTATISWTNSQTPTNYTLTQTGISSGTLSTTYTTSNLFQDVTNLLNGGSYTFTVTANYLNGSVPIDSLPLNYTQPATSTYFTGYNSSNISGSNTTLTFTTSGILTYNCPTPINNVQIFVVGGGGGGGGGKTGSFSTVRGGAGGGGGEIIYLAGQTIDNTSNAIQITAVGAAGAAGSASSNGGNGTASSLIFYGLTHSSTFGKGGEGGDGNINNGGDGGGLGATEGGKGGNEEADGESSNYYITNGFRDGGGGGGGVYSSFGGGGGNGSGGISPKPSPPTTSGQSGVAYGGGGGGGGSLSNGSQYPGGAGRQGVVDFIIPN